MENGELPSDEKLLGPMIRNVCYANAKNYMAFPGVAEDVPAKKPDAVDGIPKRGRARPVAHAV
jgi:hypothetical protein